MNGLCRIEKDPLVPFLDLGNHPIYGFLKAGEKTGETAHLVAGIGKRSKLVQLLNTDNPANYYEEYFYRSGINPEMQRELADVVETAQWWIPKLKHADIVLDIGANDGTLLGNYPRNLFRVAVDPAKNLVAGLYDRGIADHVIPDFFSARSFLDAVHDCRAQIITSIAMFYDLEDPLQFMKDVAACLSPTGVWVMQTDWLPLVLAQKNYSTFCIEHLCYYSLNVLDSLYQRAGLKIVDVESNPTNGGSIRIYAVHRDNKLSHVAKHRKTVGWAHYESHLLLEEDRGLDSSQLIPYEQFRIDVETRRADLRDLLEELNRNGKKVLGLGASTKGNTVLNYCGIGPDLLPCIGDRDSKKWGMRTAGTDIPIVSEEEMRREHPAYLLVLPWHFLNSILEREAVLRQQGTRFIVPLPDVSIIE